MALNLFTASNQWATRPDDERFWSLAEAEQAALQYRKTARIARGIPYNTLRTEARDQEVYLLGRQDTPARLTHWSFGQLSQRAGAPAGYLRQLPATLAVQNLNHGLKNLSAQDGAADILLHQNGGYLCRAFTSDVYGRIWNHEVINRARALEARGWRVPPARPAHEGQALVRPATAADVLTIAGAGSGASVKVGDLIAPAGVYVSDHDCFLFLISENTLSEQLGVSLHRGVFITNSEVGAASLRITRFLFRGVCGNHIVWDAQDVCEIRLRHVGESVGSRFRKAIEAEIRWVNESAHEDEQKISRAQRYRLGDDKDAVLDRLFGIKSLGASRALLEASYEAVEPDVDGDPRTAWGFAQGLTRESQKVSYADERDRIDRIAGKVIEIAF